MVERGRAKVAPAPRLLPRRLRLPRRPPPHLRRGDHRTGIPPPVSPRRARRRRGPDQWVEGSRILLAISSLRVFAGAFPLFLLWMRRTIFIIWDSLSPTSLRDREGRNSVVQSLWRVPAARRLLNKKKTQNQKLREKSRLPSRA